MIFCFIANVVVLDLSYHQSYYCLCLVLGHYMMETNRAKVVMARNYVMDDYLVQVRFVVDTNYAKVVMTRNYVMDDLVQVHCMTVMNRD